MASSALQSISTLTAKLRDLLGGCEAKSVLDLLAWEVFHLRSQGFASSDFHSPFKQICHIGGLLVTSKEKQSAEAVEEAEWEKIKALCSEIFECYIRNYFESNKALEQADKLQMWRQDVTMQVFLQYLGAPIMRSGDQHERNIADRYVPFDGALREALGFGASDLLRYGNRLQEVQLEALTSAGEAQKATEAEHRKFVELWDEKGWSLEAMKQEAQKHPINTAIQNYIRSLQGVWVLRRDELISIEKREVDAALTSALSTQRGRPTSDYPYPTADNPFVKHPLVEIGDGEWICASPALIWMAAEYHFDPVLCSEHQRVHFFENRDQKLEERTEEVIRKLKEEGTRILGGVCETPDGQFEHDLLLNHEDTWIVFEAKASRIRRNFFDPEKAFTRLRDDFHSDRGIQKACEQGEHLRNLLLSPGAKKLYDISGQTLLELEDAVQEVLTVCVTGEYWGALGIDLSLFLEKQEATPYPWCVFIDDLDAFVRGFKFKGKGMKDVIQFLRERSGLHGCYFSEDELNIAGYFLEKGELPSFQQDAVSIFTPDNSCVFDEAYFNELGIQRKLDREAEFDKCRQGLEEYFAKYCPGLGSTTNVAKRFGERGDCVPISVKVGRNAPCPCGSGTKYKKCCGSPMRK